MEMGFWNGVTRLSRGGRSKPEQVQLDLLVAVVSRPEIERGRRGFVHERCGQAEPRQIDGLRIAMTDIARVDPQVIVFRRVEVLRPALVLLTAMRALHSIEAPRREAIRTQ